MKIKFVNLCAVFMIALFVSACGGGGGGGGDSGNTGNTTVSTTTTTTLPAAPCPDGSSVPSTGAANCPTVQVTSVNIASGAVIAPQSFTGVTATMSGKLDPASVTSQNVTLKCGADTIGVNATLSTDGKTVSLTPVIRLPFGRSCSLSATARDTLGRTVTVSGTFSTAAMVCADNSIWSNPANYSPVYQDCVADIGIQTLFNPVLNKFQDSSCVVNVGTVIATVTSACKSYMANGTIVLSKTSLVVNGHSTMWMSYIGIDGVSTLVLLDANDPNNLVPIAKMALPNPLAWIIGNPTGANIDITLADGSLRNGQVTWDAKTSSLIVTWRN